MKLKFCLKLKIFQTNFVENKKNHILYTITLKNRRFYDNTGKTFRARKTIDDNMAIARCKLQTLDYKFTLSLCNIHCCSIAGMIVSTHLSVMLHVLVNHMYVVRGSVLSLPIRCFHWALHNRQCKLKVSTSVYCCTFSPIDRYAGSWPYSPDAPRRYVRDACAPLLVSLVISTGAPRQMIWETSSSEMWNYGREIHDQI
jgi:hypothetical protein